MRKLLIKTTVLAALAVVLLTVTAAAAVIGTAVVKADSLRMRSEPSTSAATLTYLIEGTTVRVHEELDGWYKVSYGENTGYVAAEYVAYTPEAAEKAAGGEGTAAVINGSSVNFRTGPSTDHEVLLRLDLGAEVSVLSVESGWCQAVYNGQTGYISADYVSVGGLALANPRGIVTGSCVNVRSAPSTDGSILTKVYAGNIVDLVSLADGWYAVTYNGVSGYMSADYVREYTGSTASSIGEEVVALALSYLGTPYVYGGASSKGFDCSGFTMYIFSQFGYSLSHSATSQWNDSGEYVERSDLQPGDLVMFCDPSRSNGKACSHVGIYIGDNQFVHASSGSSGKYVRISSLTETYYDSYYKGAKRLG